MRQRIAIAIALACGPKLLIADEPTTALDVTVQAGILRLLDRLRRENDLAVVLITHDLGVMSAIADRVSIFYAGRVVESGSREDVLRRPRHPYTQALLDALPHPEAARDQPLVAISGSPPSPATSRRAARSTRAAPMRRRAAAPTYRRSSASTAAPSPAPSTRSPPDERARAARRRRRLRAPGRRPRAGGRRCEHHRRHRPDRRARRRVRLRQVDACARGCRARAADVGLGRLRRARGDAARPTRPRARARAAPARLPEPVRLAEPAPQDRLAARATRSTRSSSCLPRQRAGARPGAAASSSGCRRLRSTASRTSSRAGSDSGSRSRARSRPSRR